MAATGDTLSMPDGTSFRITKAAADTAGEVVEMEITVPPGSPSVPPHVHPEQEEEWHVVSGTLSGDVGGSRRSVQAGESVTIPVGQAHAPANRSSETLVFRDVHRPALDFQDYIEKLHRLAQAGKIGSPRRPSTLIYFSMVWQEHRRMQVPASAGLRAAMRVLAAVGRLLAYRTT